MKSFFLIGLISFSALAQEVSVKVTNRIKNPLFDLGIGSSVEMTYSSGKSVKDALFVGKLVDQENDTIEYLFLDLKKTRISMIDPSNVEGFRKTRAQAIVKPIDQKGSTCAAYGFFHFWNQTFAVGIKGNTELNDTMNSDRRRLQFVEEAIDIYYLQNKTNITTIMKNYGKRFGFTCKNNKFTDPKKAADFIFERTSQGKPVLLDYNIGPDMVTSSYEVIDFEKPLSPDPRLWVPRQRGERNSGGHVIVAAAAFVANGKPKVMVVDSDWSEPRVWDLEKYFAKKTAVSEMGFHTCD